MSLVESGIVLICDVEIVTLFVNIVRCGRCAGISVTAGQWEGEAMYVLTGSVQVKGRGVGLLP